MHREKDIIRQLWRSKSDEQIIEAARHLDDYTKQGIGIIQDELTRRGISVPKPVVEIILHSTKSKSHRSVIGIILGVILILYCLSRIASFVSNLYISKTTESATEESHGKKVPIQIGEKGILTLGDSRQIPVAINESVFEASNKAVAAKDEIGYLQLIASRDLLLLDANTSVLVIDRGIGKTQVRILEGLHLGKSGWVPYEWVVGK